MVVNYATMLFMLQEKSKCKQTNVNFFPKNFVQFNVLSNSCPPYTQIKLVSPVVTAPWLDSVFVKAQLQLAAGRCRRFAFVTIVH